MTLAAVLASNSPVLASPQRTDALLGGVPAAVDTVEFSGFPVLLDMLEGLTPEPSPDVENTLRA